MQAQREHTSQAVLKEKLLNLLCDLSFKYSEEPVFNLAYKKEKSNFYIDAKQTMLSPEGLVLVGEVIYNTIADLDVDAIGGMSYGADPIAISTATIANLKGKRMKAFSVRKETKNHGTKKAIEGITEPGEKVVIVDDVATTGTSTLSAIEAAKSFGLDIVKVILLVDRQEGGKERIEQETGLCVEALFTKDDLMRAYLERANKEAGRKGAISG